MKFLAAVAILNLVVTVMSLPVPDPAFPSRAWNSYDGFGITFNETLLRQQALALSTFSSKGGFDYIVIDEGWAENDQGWILDAYGRPTYNPQLYPSGMPALAQWVNELGLHLGLWMIRGIPQPAVEQKLPILGTNYTAADIALPQFACVWKSNAWGINMSHPAAQPYYDSVVALYNSWGIKYLKADCEFGQRDMVNPQEIIGLSTSVTKTNREVRLGLSPGVNALVSEALQIHRYVNAYRITDDLWDCWSSQEPCHVGDGISVFTAIDRLVNFSVMIGQAGLGHNGRSYPDPDSLPFGVMRLMMGKGKSQQLKDQPSRMSQITPGQSQFMYALWSITLSNFVLGGDLTYLPSYLSSLYSNSDLRDVHRYGATPRVVLYNSTNVFWMSKHRTKLGVYHLGVFAFDPLSNATWVGTYSFTYASVGIPAGVKALDVYCTVQQKSLGTWIQSDPWVMQMAANLGTVLRLTATVV